MPARRARRPRASAWALSLASVTLSACGAQPSTLSHRAANAPGRAAAASAPSASASASVAASVGKPSVDEAPCEQRWAADAHPVALAWDSCAPSGEFQPVVSRGFPAIGADGASIAWVEHQDLPARATHNLAVTVTALATGAVVLRKSILGAMEFDEPYAPLDAAARATVQARLDAVNGKLASYRPMSASSMCDEPVPWGARGETLFDGCRADPPKPQTLRCTSRPASGAGHRVELSLRGTTLTATLDDEKKPSLVRDLRAMVYGWDQGETPDNRGKPVQFFAPHLVEASVDFASGALLVKLGYCNTADIQPTYPERWEIYRLPKRP
jgi:hypothetical protein